jgi:type VI protein secretion system component VasF
MQPRTKEGREAMEWLRDHEQRMAEIRAEWERIDRRDNRIFAIAMWAVAAAAVLAVVGLIFTMALPL